MTLLLKYLKPYRLGMCVGAFFKLFAAFMDLVLPMILSYMIDDIVPQSNVDLIIYWSGVMVICSMLAIVTNLKANQMASKVSRDATENIRNDLFGKVMSLSSSQFDALTIPSIEIRLTSDTYNIHRTISMLQRIGLRAPFLLIGGIVMTLLMEPILAMVMILMLPLLSIIIMYISKKGIPMYKGVQESYDRLIRVVRENISGIRVIKALSKEEFERDRFAHLNSNAVKKEIEVGRLMSLTNPLMNFFLNGGLVLVIVVGAFVVAQGWAQTGVIIAFMTYFTIILNAMLSMTRIFVMTSKATASAKRIQEVLELPEDLQVIEKPQIHEDAHIVFDQVSFSYQKKKHDVKEISFTLNRGETLGIIGATGSGKSTIISLLMRFYDVDHGEIRIDGQPLQSIERQKLHTMFGVALQNDFVISESILDNISFGRELEHSQIEVAARSAQAIDFIQDLDDRFDHRVSARGTNLSGGQKQRLLVARALASHPDVLILDDSSSALDYKTDAKLRKQLKENYQDVTTVIVAQRVSSIQHADKILVLEQGSMIGYGSHQYLLETCEYYRFIHESQMGGELSE